MYKNYKFDVVTEASVPGAKVQVVTFPLLRGSDDVNTAEHLFFANEAGMKLKMVKIELKDSSLRVEPGALYHMCGDLKFSASKSKYGLLIMGCSNILFALGKSLTGMLKY